jgi:hypothetical protein
VPDPVGQLALAARLGERQRLAAAELVDDRLRPAPARGDGVAVLGDVTAGQGAVQLRGEVLVGEPVADGLEVAEQDPLRRLWCAHGACLPHGGAR